MEKALGNKKAILIFVLPGLIWFVMIAIFPIFQSLGYSFFQWNGITKATFVGVDNYIEIMKDSLFYKAVWNSFLLALVSVLIQLPISMVIALVLAKGVKGEGIYRTVFFIPVIISSTIIAQMWMKIYHPDYGLLNTFLRSIGLESMQKQWLADGKFALIAVFIPMMKASTIFAIIGSLKSFDLVYVLTKGGPLHATEVPTLLMYNEIFTSNRYGYASGMALIIILECLLFTGLVQIISKKFEKKWG